MKKFFKTIFFLIISILPTILFAEEPSTTLTQLLKNMRSMQANFTQSLVGKNGKVIQRTSGKMSLQRPSQFRWEVMQPNKQLIVTNGSRLWIFEPELEQVTIRTLSGAAGDTPALLLSDGNLSLAKEFKVSTPGTESAAMQWFLLIPRDQGSMISTLKLGFANGQIKQMHLRDHLGHTTLIQFSNVKLNSSLPASLFKFNPPARIDIIDETKKR